jgi:hypothetical protein
LVSVLVARNPNQDLDSIPNLGMGVWHVVRYMKKLLKLIKKNLFTRVRTSEKVDTEGRKILMVEEIDPDYRYGDFRDEINDVERVRKIRKG